MQGVNSFPSIDFTITQSKSKTKMSFLLSPLSFNIPGI